MNDFVDYPFTKVNTGLEHIQNNNNRIKDYKWKAYLNSMTCKQI